MLAVLRVGDGRAGVVQVRPFGEAVRPVRVGHDDEMHDDFVEQGLDRFALRGGQEIQKRRRAVV